MGPEVHDFVHISDNDYTGEPILNTEKTVLNTLQFNLTVPTPYVFVSHCLKAAAVDQEVSILNNSEIGAFRYKSY
jgi:cyclin B